MKTPKIKKEKKPFRETKFGIWLKENDSELFEFIAGRIKGEKPIGAAFKALLIFLAKVTDEKKEEAKQLVELDN